jgi:hypothetical protein
MDNYYAELFIVIGAVIDPPIFKRPTGLVTRFYNLADDFVLSMVPAAGVCDGSVVIVAARDQKLARPSSSLRRQ